MSAALEAAVPFVLLALGAALSWYVTRPARGGTVPLDQFLRAAVGTPAPRPSMAFRRAPVLEVVINKGTAVGRSEMRVAPILRVAPKLVTPPSRA